MNRIARLILDNLNLKVFVPLLILALATARWCAAEISRV